MIVATHPLNQKTASNVDRRHARRYPIKLEMQWRLVRYHNLLSTGAGSTLDISSNGFRFDAGCPLPVGLGVELLVAWPSLEDNNPRQLKLSGEIVRCSGGNVAIRIVRRDF